MTFSLLFHLLLAVSFAWACDTALRVELVDLPAKKESERFCQCV